jgi:hypothetical protein
MIKVLSIAFGQQNIFFGSRISFFLVFSEGNRLKDYLFSTAIRDCRSDRKIYDHLQ